MTDLSTPPLPFPALAGNTPATAETLRHFAIFADLGKPQRERLLSQMRLLTVPARTLLLTAEQPGHAVYFLIEGSVKIGLERPTGPRTAKPFSIGKAKDTLGSTPAPATGAQVMLNLCGPGAVLGEMSVLDERGHSANVITREKCRLLWLDKDVFLELLRERPEVSLALLRECSDRQRNATHQLHAYATLDAAGRIAHALLHLARRFGTPLPQGTALEDTTSKGASVGGLRLDINLTQPEISDLTGLTRTRVNTVIAIFKKNDWLIQEEGGALLLLDMQNLATIAQQLP